MNDPLTDVRFWAQVLTPQRSVIVCSPDLESRVKGRVDAHGLGDLITVNASPVCPDGTIFVINT